MDGYFRDGSFLSYESDYMCFSYHYGSDRFVFRWKDKRWGYRRPKISYIPSERNLVASIPNWFEVSMGRNNIRNFMTDWEFARKSVADNREILNLGVSYHYDKDTRKDQIRIAPDKYIDFTNASSGLQSLVPMYVFIDYLYSLPNKDKKISNLADEWSDNELLSILYNKLFAEKDKTGPYVVNTMGTAAFRFGSAACRDEFLDICTNYLQTRCCDLFLEEPENNLFPPTQAEVVGWLLDKTNAASGNGLMVATHSPYILTGFLSARETDLGMFVVYALDDGYSSVKSLTPEDQAYIYGNGIDAFFNLENLIGE